MKIELEFEEALRLARRLDVASEKLDRNLSSEVPADIRAGEVSDLLAGLVMGFMECASVLVTYGQGIALVAEQAVVDLSGFDGEMAHDLNSEKIDIFGERS